MFNLLTQLRFLSVYTTHIKDFPTCPIDAVSRTGTTRHHADTRTGRGTLVGPHTPSHLGICIVSYHLLALYSLPCEVILPSFK